MSHLLPTSPSKWRGAYAENCTLLGLHPHCPPPNTQKRCLPLIQIQGTEPRNWRSTRETLQNSSGSRRRSYGLCFLYWRFALAVSHNDHVWSKSIRFPSRFNVFSLCNVRCGVTALAPSDVWNEGSIPSYLNWWHFFGFRSLERRCGQLLHGPSDFYPKVSIFPPVTTSFAQNVFLLSIQIDLLSRQHTFPSFESYISVRVWCRGQLRFLWVWFPVSEHWDGVWLVFIAQSMTACTEDSRSRFIFSPCVQPIEHHWLNT